MTPSIEHIETFPVGVETPETTKRRPGRPKGSKNKQAQPRVAHIKTTHPELVERDAAWSQEAKPWAEDHILRLVDSTPDAEHTVADFMDVLDHVDTKFMPTGYIRFIDSELYPKRYNIVHVVCLRLARQGLLDVGSTVNAKGMENVACYRKAAYKPPLKIHLEGANVTEATRTSFEKWLAIHGPSIDNLMVTREGIPVQEEPAMEDPAHAKAPPHRGTSSCQTRKGHGSPTTTNK